ncbi:DNA phosphorothioation-dependent restriction protein DptF [Endozoicomonas atrinae]|uniref:DNA phosphorothioation-dependent restriction protein DptF n=1 Tax=Endozoicomonas atrinae TaxID=1333660 RepID=UPI0008271CC6|nr:DNA phosphorothioation-dependent restriction protein DptF [Endozoicomonas atrinae]
MTFRKMLDTLSRSSAHAVSTLGNRNNRVKEYLYIETDVEKAFKKAITTIESNDEIIFLCGSSGDGKSEILTRYYDQYHNKITFHLDATHSFQPDKDAIATLDELFTQHIASNKPLIVGINTGMLFNYSDCGSDEHIDIRSSIKHYLSGKQKNNQPSKHTFINFEDHPKYVPVDDAILSPFIQEVLYKLTQASGENPFYQAWKAELKESDPILHSNYVMLQQKPIQKLIIQTLLKLRLKSDFFLTARTILDVIHQLLTGPKYLFDNLFASDTTDLFRNLQQFDPCNIRSKEIDLFLIQNSLEFEDSEFSAFKNHIEEWIDPDQIKNQPGSWLRLFYLFKDIELQGLSPQAQYHRKFSNNFNNELIEEYTHIWLLHSNFEGDADQRSALRAFYSKELIKALLRFANRFAPQLSDKSQIFLNHLNGYTISAKVDIRASLKRVQEERPKKLGYFNAYLKLDDHDLAPLPVSVNFLDLICKINRGYRPNRHDKNVIVLLEEVIESITAKVRHKDRIQITKDSETWSLINDMEEYEIRVER